MKKICCRCKEEKDLKEFNKLKQSKDGYRYQCRECQKIDSIIDKPKRLIRDLKNRDKLLVSWYKRHDRDKNRENDLTVEWFKENISSKPCIYCGDTEKIGADRIDNSKGHTKDNVVPCCDLCNATRSNNFTLEEMVRIGKVIKEIKNDRLRKDNKS